MAKKPKNTRLSDAQREEIHSLVAAGGKTLQAIADAVGCSVLTVRRYRDMPVNGKKSPAKAAVPAAAVAMPEDKPPANDYYAWVGYGTMHGYINKLADSLHK